MAPGRRYWWLVILGVVGLVDIVGRLAMNFDMPRVALFEAILFVGTCALFATITKGHAPRSRALKRLECGFAVVFGLASVRVMVWAAGARVAVANMAALVLGLILLVGIVLWKRHASHRRLA